MNIEFDIQYLVSYLTGNCSQNECEIVEDWINQSYDNLQFFTELKKVWNSSSVNHSNPKVDVDKAWADFVVKANFNESENAVQRVKQSNSTKIRIPEKVLYYTYRVAAFIIVVLGLSLLFEENFDGKSAEIQNYVASANQIANPMLLPDGSVVSLKIGARINYPSKFADDFRNVSFEGEAFFDVAHNAEKPFVISAGNVRVKVLGTSFELRNCKKSDEVTVFLETGKVMFYSIDEIDGKVLEQIILHPGEKGIYNKKTGLITKDVFENKNYKAWKTGDLEFVNAPLIDVFDAIESNYNVKVDLQVDLSNYSLTAKFNNETPQSIFKSLQMIYGFDCNINNDTILVY